MVADITAYEVGKFVHVLAVVLAFGPTFAYGLFMSLAAQYPNAAPALLRGVERTDRFLVIPFMAVLLAAGLYTLAEGDISASESWVTVGFAAMAILVGLQFAFFSPQVRKARGLAERDLAAGDALGDEFAALGRRFGQVGALAGVVIVAAVFFMVAKP